ncbi:MAG: hypothetical protein JNK75_06595 [Betaproteobacteria bacterium]|nr:hypothetical protein [Betaproteobacteria bacterium]
MTTRRNPYRTWLAALAVGLAGCAVTPTPAPVAVDRDWFIFLETGKKTPDDKARVQAMQRGHLENFKRLFGERKLFAAGPLRDPAGVKRGIVVVRARDRATLDAYFQPDEYVREGYMTLNATPVTVMKPLATEGIDANAIEEVRIVQVLRNAPVDAARIQSAIDQGTFGAGYQLESGPLSHILFARDKDEARLRAALGITDPAHVLVWAQWIGKGVVR